MYRGRCPQLVIGSAGRGANLTTPIGLSEELHMLARYIKMQLLVLLCGGLVGPIFLVVYFTMGLGSLLSWMFYVGLLITVADVLIALALTNYGAKAAAKSAELEQRGVLALAQITGLSETGTRINEQPVVKVNLHIAGPGLLPFDGQDRVIG